LILKTKAQVSFEKSTTAYQRFNISNQLHALKSNHSRYPVSYLYVSALPGCHHQGVFIVKQAVLGGPYPLPKLSSTLLGPANYVSNSSRPPSLDLPQLTQATST